LFYFLKNEDDVLVIKPDGILIRRCWKSLVDVFGWTSANARDGNNRGDGFSG
jgi:hypothetical protein